MVILDGFNSFPPYAAAEIVELDVNYSTKLKKVPFNYQRTIIFELYTAAGREREVLLFCEFHIRCAARLAFASVKLPARCVPQNFAASTRM